MSYLFILFFEWCIVIFILFLLVILIDVILGFVYFINKFIRMMIY